VANEAACAERSAAAIDNLAPVHLTLEDSVVEDEMLWVNLVLTEHGQHKSSYVAAAVPLPPQLQATVEPRRGLPSGHEIGGGTGPLWRLAGGLGCLAPQKLI